MERIECAKRLFLRLLPVLLGFKRGSTATTTGCVGIFNLESSIIERIDIIDPAAFQQRQTVGSDNDRHAILSEHLIALGRLGNPHRILQAGTASALNSQPQATACWRATLRQQMPELTDGRVGELNHEREMRGEDLVCFPQQTFRCKCYALTHHLNCSFYVKNPHSF
jgi:hypothetical protein